MRSLDNFLSNELKQKVRDQKGINTIIQHGLPAPLNQHVWFCSLKNGVLKLQTDNPTWATQLRYQQHELIKQLNTDPALRIKKCIVTISPKPFGPKNPPNKPTRLSPSAKQSIRSAAKTLSDPGLRELFEKFAR